MKMKRAGLFAAVLCVASLIAAAPVSANSWGLKGALYRAVASTHTWDDYSVVGGQGEDFALMGARYHNALFYAEDNAHLQVYHTAVWQPEDHVRQSIQQTDDGLILSAGSERYTFRREEGRYALVEAKLDGATVFTERSEDYGGSDVYWFSDGNRRAFYRATPLWLEDFNIRLFPRTVDDVLAVNHMRAALESGINCLEYRDSWRRESHVGEKTAPVYSAPFGESAWRAAKGKAAVGLKGEFWTLRGYTNGDGEAWTCVMYDVSERTSRIGWVKNTLLGDAALGEPLDETWVRMLNVDVRAARDTFLTDDPFVSQFAQLSVPKGTTFQCMGMLGNDWAYVTAEVSAKNTFTDGGAIVWGFVPLRDLILMEDEIQYDVMQQLEGAWYMTAGGNMAEDALILHADGTYESGYTVYREDGGETGVALAYTGTWYVTRYNDFQNKYWYPAEYEITLLLDDGRANVKALSLDENGFSLMNAEGGGGYERAAGGVYSSASSES